MLQNAYLLAKIGADTAENERNFAENLPKIGEHKKYEQESPSAERSCGREVCEDGYAPWGDGVALCVFGKWRRRPCVPIETIPT